MPARVVVTLLLVAAVCPAAQIILSTSNVIGGTASWGGSGYTVGQYNDTKILDQQTGIVSDVVGSTFYYWLSPDNGPANAYILIDLGASYYVTSFDLFNTHNNTHNDRGTGNFRIEGGNAVTFVSGGQGYDLTGATGVLVNGTLTAAASPDPIGAQSFTATAPGYYRYIKFEPLSVATSGSSCCGANNYGLAELRVFEGEPGVPEPASLSLLACGIAGLALLRRRIAR